MGRAKNIPENKDAMMLPYQAAWIRDGSRLKLMEKSRQIGLTWATADSLVRRKARKGERYDAWVSSRDEIQAKLFIDDCKEFVELYKLAADDLGLQVLEDGKSSAFVLKFANGTRINSMSSSPDAQAGKRGDRLLDEFALHRDPRMMYAVAYPGITWGGQLEIVSTHRGSGNFFNELVREVREKGNPKGISLHRVTLQDALDQGFLFKLQNKLPADYARQEMDEADYFNFIRSGCADEESFQQEYMCSPADDDAAFLEYGLISAVEYSAGTDWRRLGNGRLFAGVDIGRKKDLTVLWVVEQLGDVLYTRHVEGLQNMRKSEQEKVIWPWFERCDRICIDATGLGIGWADDAQDKFGEHRVEAVTFTPRSKEALAYPIRGAMEDRTLRIPQDPKIRADLRQVTKQVSTTGNVRFTAERTPDGHADHFWALGLAVHAASSPSAPIEFMSGGPRDSSQPLSDFIHG